MALPWNETAADIEIESVDAVNPQGLAVLGVRASYPGPSDGIVFATGFPPVGLVSEPIEHAKIHVFGSPTTSAGTCQSTASERMS